MQVWHPHGYFRTGLIISKWPRLSLIILSSRFPKSFFGGNSRAASCRSKHNTNTTLSTQSSELQVIRHNTITTLSTQSREPQAVKAMQGNFIYLALFYKRQTQSASHTIKTSVRVMLDPHLRVFHPEAPMHLPETAVPPEDRPCLVPHRDLRL